MTPEALLTHLERLDIRLWEQDGKLRCDAPAGALTDELRQQIGAAKSNLLQVLTKREQPRPMPPATMLPATMPLVARDGTLPLSFSQERIWALNCVDPASNVTGNIPYGFRISGPLQVTALGKSLNALVQRHEVFRTCCQMVEGGPVQAILPELYLPLSVEDLSTLTPAAQQAVIDQRVQEMVGAPFDLTVAPLLRVGLLQTGIDQYLLLLTTHVFIFDGSSTAILFQELATLYADCCAGRTTTLAPLQRQYGDFAHWHRRWLTGEVLAAQKAHWLATLHEVILPIALPTNRPEPVTTVYASAELPFTLPDFLTNRVRDLAQRTGTTLFIILLAAYQALLYRYSAQRTIAIGAIVSNRKTAESERLIGSFANNILIRAELAPDLTFQALLSQVRHHAHAAYANQDLPLELLLGELPAALNRTPFFRVMFLLHQQQNSDTHGLPLPGVKVEKYALAKGVTKYALNLVMTDFNGVLGGSFEYSRDHFDLATVHRLREQYLLLLKAVVADPALPLSELPMWSEAAEPIADGAPPCPPERSTPYVAPRTPVEATLARIWQQHFGLDQIGIHDDFCALGGHSLLAVSIFRAIQARCSVAVQIDSIRHFPTIAQWAQIAEGNRVISHDKAK